MQYSKHFEHDGITIIFDKLELSKEYPNQYIIIRKGNMKASAFIEKRKIKVTSIQKVSDTFSVAVFGFYE